MRPLKAAFESTRWFSVSGQSGCWGFTRLWLQQQQFPVWTKPDRKQVDTVSTSLSGGQPSTKPGNHHGACNRLLHSSKEVEHQTSLWLLFGSCTLVSHKFHPACTSETTRFSRRSSLTTNMASQYRSLFLSFMLDGTNKILMLRFMSLGSHNATFPLLHLN